jgi:uncharacterized membrane protein
MTPEFTRGQIHPIECAKEGFARIKEDYWLLFAIALVGLLIAGVSMYVLMGPMICGIFICYLKCLDGKKVVFDDLWLGFKYFGRSVLLVIVTVVPIVIYFVAVFTTLYLPLIVQAMAGNRNSNNAVLGAFLTAIVIDIVIAVIMVCIHSLLMFAFPLMADRGLSSIDAIKLSARAALKNVAGIGGLIGVNFVLAIVGEALCGVGLYLVMPIILATNLVAYRKVFPALDAPALEPPPPTAYPEIA